MMQLMLSPLAQTIFSIIAVLCYVACAFRILCFDHLHLQSCSLRLFATVLIGAAFLAFTQESLSYGKRIFSLMLSVALGYALAPEISNRTGINSHTVIACFTSMFALPVLVKVMTWVNKSTLTEIFNTTSKFFSALSSNFGKENKK